MMELPVFYLLFKGLQNTRKLDNPAIGNLKPEQCK